MNTEEDNTQASGEYVRFDELTMPVVPSDPSQFFSGMKLLFDDRQNWRSPLTALTILRQINKYYPSESNNMVIGFWENLLSCLEHARPVLSKTTLLLLQEFIAVSQIQNEVLLKLEPLLAAQAFADKKFLQAEARKAYEFLVTKSLGEPLIYSLANTALTPKHQVEDLSMRALENSISKVGSQLYSFSEITYAVLFKAIQKSLASRRESAKPVANICRILFTILGQENFTKLVLMLREKKILEDEDLVRLQAVFGNEKSKDEKLNAARQIIREQKARAKSIK